MSTDSAPINLTHHFLIAMPGMRDETFGRSVVYLCEHSERGALGLVINKPSDINLRALFEKVELPTDRTQIGDSPVFQGGPVKTERGFVLHEPMLADPPDNTEPVYASTMTIPGGLELTTSKDVLEAVANGSGPHRFLLTLGYAGWGAGQLEEELSRNGWLTVQADPEIIFSVPPEERFAAAVRLLGIDVTMLSGEAGHA